MKLFPSVPVDFMPGDTVSTRQHPIQAFSWSDCSAKPGHHYTFRVLALNGTPANPQEMLATDVEVHTEAALLAFLGRATDAHWGLRVAAYEFTHVPMLKALRAAHTTRKVDVKTCITLLKSWISRSTGRARNIRRRRD